MKWYTTIHGNRVLLFFSSDPLDLCKIILYYECAKDSCVVMVVSKIWFFCINNHKTTWWISIEFWSPVIPLVHFDEAKIKETLTLINILTDGEIFFLRKIHVDKHHWGHIFLNICCHQESLKLLAIFLWCSHFIFGWCHISSFQTSYYH